MWTWNGYYLGLKLSQGAAVSYAVAVFLGNIWTYIRGNQTSLRFACAPPTLEDYLEQLVDVHSDSDLELESSNSDQVDQPIE